MTSPYDNQYDENGRRTLPSGGYVTRMRDEAILYNLKFKWKDKTLSEFSDKDLIDAYYDFLNEENSDEERFLDYLTKDWPF